MRNNISAVIFANVMMILFYLGLFMFSISIVFIIEYEEIADILSIAGGYIFVLSLIGSLLTIRTDNLEGKTNIIHKAIWYWGK